eukprot:m.120817 g.120817  ORF g.120817 m.120817 type:complete len:621 (+) comp11067_c0_seq1:170-2032(+)
MDMKHVPDPTTIGHHDTSSVSHPDSHTSSSQPLHTMTLAPHVHDMVTPVMSTEPPLPSTSSAVGSGGCGCVTCDNPRCNATCPRPTTTMAPPPPLAVNDADGSAWQTRGNNNIAAGQASPRRGKVDNADSEQDALSETTTTSSMGHHGSGTMHAWIASGGGALPSDYTGPAPIDRIPNEVLAAILTQLDTRTLLLSVPLVCRRWRRTCAMVPNVQLDMTFLSKDARLRHVAARGKTSRWLGAIFALFPQVTSLSLREFAKLTDEAVETVSRRCPHLRAVDFTCCHQLTRGAAVALALKCPHLTSVTFKGCGGAIDSFVDGLVDALRINSSIRRVELGHNAFGEDRGKAIAAALLVNRGVESMGIQFNSIGPAAGIDIANSLCRNNHITFLNLCDNNLDETVARAFGAMLKTNKTLIFLDLCENPLGSEGAAALAEGLADNKTLKGINLECTGLGPEGGEFLAGALKVNQSLTCINLHWNELGDAGGIAFGKALRHNRSLANVSLCWNQLGPDAGHEIACALKTNTSVVNIDLQRNQLGEGGGKAIAEALKVNRTIQAVNLEWNNIGDDAQEAIAHALKLNTSVKECTWDRCADTLNSEDCVRIAEAQKINHYDDIPKHQF